MNPQSERRFPLIPFAKADAGASPGAAAFLEDLIDACVMECYFREHMAERDLLFHDIVAPHLAAARSSSLTTSSPARIVFSTPPRTPAIHRFTGRRLRTPWPWLTSSIPSSRRENYQQGIRL